MAPVSGPRGGMIAKAAVVGLSGLVAVLTGCDETDPASADVVPVKLGGKTFYLELAAEDSKRMKGLGGRTHIEEDGGMLFVFPPSQVRVQNFLMRDCPIDMDIIYLDGAGRVLTTYTMKKEPPRAADGSEGKEGEFGTGNPSGTAPADRYEQRLPKYSSRFPSTFVIEVQAGTVQKLGVKEGDQVGLDVAALKRRAR